MKYATSFQELDSLGEGLSKDYLRKSRKQNELPFDIEGFITGYLGLTIIYENFAEEDKSKIGFVSDGERPLLVYRNGLPCPVIFPRDAVVIEKFLLKSSEYNRRRFTLAHEAAHKILERHLPFGATASFHTEQDAEADYTRERIDRELSINEVYANRLGAAILMPQFLVQKVLRKYNSGKPLVCYEGNVFAAADRMKIQKMADLLGVSYTAFLVRLREFKLLDYHPIEEYLSEGLQFGGSL